MAGAFQPGIPSIPSTEVPTQATEMPLSAVEVPTQAAEMPLSAVEVVSEWAQQAFNAEGYVFKVRNDTEMQGFYWSMEQCLMLMDKSITEGIPKYVFALTPTASLESFYIDDVKAIAIATVHPPPDGGGDRELLHIDGAIAAPSEHEQGQMVAELVRSVTRWGANANRFGSVTFSPHPFFEQYYERLGLAPGDLLWPSRQPPRDDEAGSPGGHHFQMVTLAMGAEPSTAVV